MAQFPVLRLTRAGQDMVGASQGGGKLIFVRAELGDGQLGEGDSIETLSAIKHRVMQLPLQGCLNEGNGKARLRFVVDNGSLTTGFFNREIGIIAKMEGGDEKLYAYTNAGNYADYIPSKDTPIDSEIIDLHILIGNASQVVLQTANGAYATKIELEEHRTAAELDHPNKSVHKKHLAFEVYDKGEVDTRLGGKANSSHGNHIPNPEVANNARFLRNDNTWQAVTPGNIGAYTKTETYSKSESYNKGEVDNRVNTRVSKSGDTMTGDLKFTESDNTHSSIFPSHYFHNLWNNGDTVYMHAFPSHAALAKKTTFEFRTADGVQNKWTPHKLNSDGFTTPTLIFSNGGYIGDYKRDVGDAITDNGGANVNIGAWFGLGFYSTYSKRYTGTMDLRSGNWRTIGQMIAHEGFHARGDVGLVFSDHGGGWFMSDNDWIRALGEKNVYTAGKIKANGGFEGKASSAGWADSAGNSNTLAGQSLQWILDKINASKTGIVAGNLAENGWVKFANGLIVQWGAVNPPNRSVNFPVSFPSKIFQLLYTTELHFNEVPDGTWFRLKNKTLSGAEWLALTATGRFYIAVGI